MERPPERDAADPAAAPAPNVAHWRTYLWRTLRRNCPRCGEGALFASRFRLAERCEVCGLVYRREQGAMTGQMYLTAVATEVIAALLVLLIFFGTDWGVATSLAVSIPIVFVASYLIMPLSTGAWVAIEFLTDVSNGEPWVLVDERRRRAD